MQTCTMSVHNLPVLPRKVEAWAHVHRFASCRQLLCQAMAAFPDAPEPHNLLGIVYELQGMRDPAARQYRAALALGDGYRPAQRNLMRVTSFEPKCFPGPDWG